MLCLNGWHAQHFVTQHLVPCPAAMGEPVEGVVLALTDIDTALAGEELLDFGGKLLILEPGARALVQKALSLPKWQQEELTRRLAARTGLGAEEGDVSLTKVTEVVLGGGDPHYEGPVPQGFVETTSYYRSCMRNTIVFWGFINL